MRSGHGLAERGWAWLVVLVSELLPNLAGGRWLQTLGVCSQVNGRNVQKVMTMTVLMILILVQRLFLLCRRRHFESLYT